MVQITHELAIDDAELEFAYARSSGPGGQNVNKVETKVTLRFALFDSPSLDDAQKQRLAGELATRITKDGILRVTSQRHRTRAANQKAATERFAELLAEALDEDPERKKTKVPRAAKKRRLENKRRRAEKKRLRSPPRLDD